MEAAAARRRERAREGGRSETRHLKLAPTKTTTAAAGRSRERADGRTADGRAGVLELPKPSELVQKISSFTAAAAAAFGAANYRAERAWVRGGRESGAAAGRRRCGRRRCTRRADEDLSLNSRKTDPKMTENKSSEEDEGGEEEERSGEEESQ